MVQRILTIILILVVVVFGGFYAYNELMPEKVIESTGPIYSTQEAFKGDISVGVETTGMLNETYGGSLFIPGERYTPNVINYVIEEIFAKEGDSVKKDQVIVKLKSPELEDKVSRKKEELQLVREELSQLTKIPVDEVDNINPYEGITIKSPISGRIVNLNVSEGDKLGESQAILKIVDDSKFIIQTKVTQSEFKNIKVGQSVKLKFPYYDGFTEGKITMANPNPVPHTDEKGVAKGFVHIVKIEGKNPGLVQPNMELNVGLSNGSDDSNVTYLLYTAKVEGFGEERRVLSQAGGTITEVFVYESQFINKGDSLVSMAGSETQELIREKLNKIRDIKLEINDLYGKFDAMEVRAPMDGIITRINKQVGESVPQGDWLGAIYNTSEMMLFTQVDDIDILSVKQDALVKVTVDALPGETFEGKVENVSTRPIDSNGITKYDVWIKVNGGSNLRPGMHANAFIDGGSAEDVLLVPLEAIFEEDGKMFVEVLGEDNLVKLVNVKLGLMNDRYAEVESGLEVGNKVVTGSSEDILPSQDANKKNNLLPTNDKPQDSNNKNE